MAMTQQEIEQWIAQQGGDKRVQYKRSSQKVANPAKQRTLPDGTDNDDWDPTAPATVEVNEEKWVAVDAQGKPTGAELNVRRRPDGDFDIVNQANQNPAAPASATTKPSNVYIGTNPTTGKQTQVSEYPDGNGGVRKEYDDTQVPAAATGEAKPPTTEDRGGRRYVWQPNPGGPSAGGKWADIGDAPETPAERTAREANAPTQTVTRDTGGDGKPYTVITIVPKPGQPGQPGQIVLGPDGKPAPGGVPGKPATEKREPVTKNGKTYIQVSKANPDGSSELRFEDQAGNRVTLPDDVSNTALPDGVSGFVPDTSGPNGNGPDGDYGIGEYSRRVQAQVGPNLSRDEGRKLVEAALGQANAAESRRQTRVSEASATRTQDIGQRNTDVQAGTSRFSSAGSSFGNVLSTLSPLITGAGAGNGGVAADAILGMLGAVQRYQQQAAGPMPGQVGLSPALAPYASPGGPQAAAPAAPAVTVTVGGQPAAPTPANAIGLGSIGNQMAPEAAAAVGGPPSIPMTPERVQGIMANPVFRPSAPVGTVNPPAGQPGNDPTQPVGMSPMQQSAMQQAYNPASTSSRLLELGFDPETVARAHADFGGGS